MTLEERTRLEEELDTKLSNAVYKAALVYEEAESLGLLHGNGHHMAQALAMEACNRLQERFRIEREVLTKLTKKEQ